jgi:hypothetical protein
MFTVSGFVGKVKVMPTTNSQPAMFAAELLRL